MPAAPDRLIVRTDTPPLVGPLVTPSTPAPATAMPPPLPRAAHAARTVRVLLASPGPQLLEIVNRSDGAWARLRVVGVAPSAAHALYLAGQAAPDVLLLECRGGSLAPLDALAALGALSRIAVILYGLHGPDRARAALSAGAAAVIEPESRPAEVLAAILRCAHSASAQEPSAPPALQWLTTREREVVHAVVRHPGAKYLVIGEQLGISEHTVHNHLSNIYQKLNLVNRADLMMYAVRHRIVPPGAGQG